MLVSLKKWPCVFASECACGCGVAVDAVCTLSLS